MSFRIAPSSKYAKRHPSPKDLQKDSSLLSDEDYMLFGIDGQSSSGSSSQRSQKAPRIGHCIRDSHAQSDYY